MTNQCKTRAIASTPRPAAPLHRATATRYASLIRASGFVIRLSIPYSRQPKART
jgi:hypothetical protein